MNKHIRYIGIGVAFTAINVVAYVTTRKPKPVPTTIVPTDDVWKLRVELIEWLMQAAHFGLTAEEIYEAYAEKVAFIDAVSRLK